jgi:manganese oxidase
MSMSIPRKYLWLPLLICSLVLMSGHRAGAFIDGLTGVSFQFAAKAGHITTADGNSLLFWGFANLNGPAGAASLAQYPGPTLILNEGDTVTVTLTNQLTQPVSLVFPGMTMTSATSPVFTAGSRARLSSITHEAPPGGSQTYTFTATKAGTFYYQSGSNQDIQIRMGLFGAIIVRPASYRNSSVVNKVPVDLYTGPDVNTRDPQVRANYNTPAGIGGVAYSPVNGNDMSTVYDREYLFVLSEMDPYFHKWMEFGGAYDLSKWKPNYWFINGRTAPDTMGMLNSPELPAQPYNAMPLMHPGERVLMRIVDLGRDFHPFHHHGNHARVVAVDGNLLSTNPASAGADLAWLAFTESATPGRTIDAVYTFTGANNGWDMYGDSTRIHPYEYLPDHGKTFQPFNSPVAGAVTPQLPAQPLPVVMPTIEQLIAGPNYSGSPFMGLNSPLTPGEGGFNIFNGFFYMWHSHAEVEITNFNLFPGGMLTMAGIVPWPLTGDNLDAQDNFMIP